MSEVKSIIEYSVDLSEQDAPVPLPTKSYPFEIRSAEVKTSTNTGNEYYSIGLYISPDDYPADYTEGDPDGTILMYNRLSAADKPNARYRVKKFCLAIGAKTAKKIDTTEWIGLTGTCDVGVEEFEGEKRAVVTKIHTSD